MLQDGKGSLQSIHVNKLQTWNIAFEGMNWKRKSINRFDLNVNLKKQQCFIMLYKSQSVFKMK